MDIKKRNDEIQSDVIYYLRFPLIIGVIFIHSYSLPADSNIIEDNYPIYNIIIYFFSQILGRISVPAFFLISGFLYFNNIKIWNKDTYFTKTKKRIHSLVIPYLFWNTCILCLDLLLPLLFSRGNPQIYEWNFSNYLEAYWSRENTGTPILYTFWFIRDLIVISFLSPIIYLFCKYLKFVGILILGIFWYFDIYTFLGYSITTLFFFSLGAFMSIHKMNLITTFNKFSPLSLICYPLIAVVDLLTKDYSYNLYIHHAGIVVGIISIFNIVSLAFKHNKITVSIFIANSSFFIYAMHEPLLKYLKIIVFYLINPHSEFALIIIYFALIAILVSFLLVIYYCLNKLCPKFLKIIIGGR